MSVLVERLIHSMSHLCVSNVSQDSSIFSSSVAHLQNVDANTGRKRGFSISEAVWTRSPKYDLFSFYSVTQGYLQSVKNGFEYKVQYFLFTLLVNYKIVETVASSTK